MQGTKLIGVNRKLVKQETDAELYFEEEKLIKALPKELLMKCSEKELQSIIDCIYDGIYITDGQGYTLMVNQASAKYVEELPPDIIGKNVREMVEEGYWSESICLEVIKYRKMISKVQMVEGKEVLTTAIPYFDNGELVRIVATDRDISQLQEMQEKLRQMEETAEQYESRLEYYRKKNLDGDALIYKSKKMKNLVDSAVRVAKQDVTILIQGESGTGKEKLTDMIYKNSLRSEGPFVKINCAAIPENLIESELFGYEKGTFTGAEKSGKKGLFEVADKGTLLLDEIGELPLHLQSNLLRVIQEKEIMRIGGRKRVPIDVRIIAATNVNLQEAVKEGKFREDLYYRLNVIPLIIPPLRERREDVAELIDWFLDSYNRKYKTKIGISQKAIEVFTDYDWPGNVRELKNVIERLIIILEGEEITEKQAARQVGGSVNEELQPDESLSLTQQVENFEKSLLQSTMKRAGTGSEVAKLLKVSKSTVSKKFKKHGLSF